MTDDELSCALDRVARDVLDSHPGAERLAEVLADLAVVYRAPEQRSRLIRAVARGFVAD